MKGYSVEGRRRRIEHIDAYSVDTCSIGEGVEQIEGVKGIAYTILFLLFLIGVYFLASTMSHIFTLLNEKVSNKFLLAQLMALGTLIAGICLYFIREHRRMLYALLEMAFAIVTGGAAISKLKDGDLNVWLALAASTYLVVRSLENMNKAGFTFIDKCNSYLGARLFSRQKNTDSSIASSNAAESKSQPEA